MLSIAVSSKRRNIRDVLLLLQHKILSYPVDLFLEMSLCLRLLCFQACNRLFLRLELEHQSL